MDRSDINERFANLELDDAPPRARAPTFRVPMPAMDLPPVEVGEVDERRADVARGERELFNSLGLGQLSGQAGTVAEAFAGHWAEAAMHRAFREVEGEEGARAAFGLLVSRGMIEVPGAKGDTLVDRLVEAWSYEPGSSHQAVNRAITRAAQHSGWSLDQSESLEEQAGELLFKPGVGDRAATVCLKCPQGRRDCWRSDGPFREACHGA